jgi:hypothetical protein
MPLLICDKIKGLLREFSSLEKPRLKCQIGAYRFPEEII